jgi:hypothetical protein
MAVVTEIKWYMYMIFYIIFTVVYQPFNADLSALHRPLTLHMLLASVHCIVVNVLKGSSNLKPLCPGQ